MFNLKLSQMLVLFLLVFPLTLSAQDKSFVIRGLTKKADIILTGKVSQKISTWNENKTRIFTRAKLQVGDFLKGSKKGSSVEVVYPGGEVGDVGEIYSHMPKFAENEEVLVFLKKDVKKNAYRVLNGEEGKFSVTDDSETENQMIRSTQMIKELKEQIRKFVNEQ